MPGVAAYPEPHLDAAGRTTPGARARHQREVFRLVPSIWRQERRCGAPMSGGAPTNSVPRSPPGRSARPPGDDWRFSWWTTLPPTKWGRPGSMRRMVGCRLAGRVVLVFQPAYSPDLQPTERVWRQWRPNVTHNHQRATLGALQQDSDGWFGRMAAEPGALLRAMATPACQASKSRHNRHRAYISFGEAPAAILYSKLGCRSSRDRSRHTRRFAERHPWSEAKTPVRRGGRTQSRQTTLQPSISRCVGLVEIELSGCRARGFRYPRSSELASVSRLRDYRQ